jgi:hypothetical protein
MFTVCGNECAIGSMMPNAVGKVNVFRRLAVVANKHEQFAK